MRVCVVHAYNTCVLRGGGGGRVYNLRSFVHVFQFLEKRESSAKARASVRLRSVHVYEYEFEYACTMCLGVCVCAF